MTLASAPRSLFRLPGRPAPVLVALVAVSALPELVLQAADLGLVGTPRWRLLAYQYGAFWAGLLHNWRPNFALQPWTMFLTYAVLHAGIGHLAGNMLTLVLLGQPLAARLGPWRFLCVYAGGTLGGAAAFGLMTASPQPMVGASGALFGLAGAFIARDWRQRRRQGRPAGPVLAVLAGLVLLNLLIWLALGGMLAWETHLGGFLAGAGIAVALGGRGPAPIPPDRASGDPS